MALLKAWWKLNSELCSMCGRPLAIHEHDKPSDYHAAVRECTAVQALDAFQADPPAELKAADEADRKAGRDPERARSWLAYTDREGPPKY